MPQYRSVSCTQHNIGGAWGEILQDAKYYIKNVAKNNALPNNLGQLFQNNQGGQFFYDNTMIHNRHYELCVRLWQSVPPKERGSRKNGFTGDPADNDITIHCLVDKSVVSGVFHVFLNAADQINWQQQNFRKNTIKDMQ